jgi:hypothetical protein
VFEQELSDKLKRIFGVKKVTYDEPGQSGEQECLFIEIENSNNVIKDGRAKAMVSGKAVMFGTAGKMPFGFFSKRIAEADPDDTKDFFFYDFESNTRQHRDKVQRGFSFVYFFDSQYDPETGSITSIEISEE